jgi:SNF2 family DNA or RNA helicase
MLDLVQRALQANKFDFERMDGQTSLDNRTKSIRRFTNDPTCTVMLASISAAGEG